MDIYMYVYIEICMCVCMDLYIYLFFTQVQYKKANHCFLPPEGYIIDQKHFNLTCFVNFSSIFAEYLSALTTNSYEKIQPEDGILRYTLKTLCWRIINVSKELKKFLSKNNICHLDLSKQHFYDQYYNMKNDDSKILNKTVLSKDPKFVYIEREKYFWEINHLGFNVHQFIPNPLYTFGAFQEDSSTRDLSKAMNEIASALASDFQSLAQIVAYYINTNAIEQLLELEKSKVLDLMKLKNKMNPKNIQKYKFWFNKFKITDLNENEHWAILKKLMKNSSKKTYKITGLDNCKITNELYNCDCAQIVTYYRTIIPKSDEFCLFKNNNHPNMLNSPLSNFSYFSNLENFYTIHSDIDRDIANHTYYHALLDNLYFQDSNTPIPTLIKGKLKSGWLIDRNYQGYITCEDRHPKLYQISKGDMLHLTSKCSFTSTSHPILGSYPINIIKNIDSSEVDTNILQALGLEKSFQHTHNHFVFDKEKINKIHNWQFEAIEDEKEIKKIIHRNENKSFWSNLWGNTLTGLSNLFLSPLENILLIIGTVCSLMLIFATIIYCYIKGYCKCHNPKKDIKENCKKIEHMQGQLKHYENLLSQFFGEAMVNYEKSIEPTVKSPKAKSKINIRYKIKKYKKHTFSASKKCGENTNFSEISECQETQLKNK